LIHGASENFDPKITTIIHTSNMYLVTVNGKIKKFESPEEILVEFAKTKLGYYKLRKKHMIETTKKELDLIQTKARFIELVIDDTIKIFKKSRSQIEDQMKRNGIAEEYWDECLNIKTYSYTNEEVAKMNEKLVKLRSELVSTEQTSIADMWKNDLDIVQEGE
jgi:DNA topoisomerase-2